MQKAGGGRLCICILAVYFMPFAYCISWGSPRHGRLSVVQGTAFFIDFRG